MILSEAVSIILIEKKRHLQIFKPSQFPDQSQMLETIYLFTDDINSIVFDQSTILIRTLNEHDKLYMLTYDGKEYVKQPRVLSLETV